MSFKEFLSYAMGPGVASIVAVIISLLIDYVPQYSELDAKVKRLVFMALAFVVPLAAAGIGTVVGAMDGSWANTFWPAVVAGFAASGIGTLAHTPKLKAGD